MRNNRHTYFRIGISIFIYLFLVISLSWAGWLNDKAPDFSLSDLEGKTVSLKEFKGKVVFINFWANWCQPCKKEFPELNKLAEKYEKSDFILLAVNIDKKRKHVDSFLEKYPLSAKNVMVLLDPKSKVAPSYNPRTMPTSFVIDKEGIIRYIHLGFSESDPEKWIEEVETLLN